MHQAAAQGGLVHDRLQRLLDHLDCAVPPCMSQANDWEAVDGWLDELVPAKESMPLPGIPDPGMQPYVSSPQRGSWCSANHVPHGATDGTMMFHGAICAWSTPASPLHV